jgi:DNA-binding NarL/FixJ family response regulator
VPIRVLIADDSEMMRRQIRTTLEPDQDIEICAEAENGLEAVRKAQECRPDLAVIDVSMPLMNGLEATQVIKALVPNLPVLVFTVDDSHQIRIESERAGADALLPKANGGVQLSRTIRTLVQRPLAS